MGKYFLIFGFFLVMFSPERAKASESIAAGIGLPACASLVGETDRLLENPPRSWKWGKGELAVYLALCRSATGYVNLSTLDSPGNKRDCNPARIKEDIPAHRKIAPAFLRNLLANFAITDFAHKDMLSISCAQIGFLDLSYITIRPALHLTQSHIDALDLSHSKMGANLNLSSSHIDWLTAEYAQIAGNLNAFDSTFKKYINLLNAKIGGNLDASSSTFKDEFYAEDIIVKEDIFLSGSGFKKKVTLSYAKIGGGLYASGSTFEKEFKANGIKVKGDVFLRNKASFKKKVTLSYAKIGGHLAASGSTFEEEFMANSMEVKGGVFLRPQIITENGKDKYIPAEFHGRINMITAHIGSHLQFGGSRFFGEIDLRGAIIDDELLISSPHKSHGIPQWGKQAFLNLRNAKTKILQVDMTAWKLPDGTSWLETDLTGFTYEKLGGLGATTKKRTGNKQNQQKDNMYYASSKKLITWIEKTQNINGIAFEYNPQPYQQLAHVLQSQGAPSKAREVQYAQYQHLQNVGSGNFWVDIWLAGARWLIGYSLYPFRILYWFGLLVLAGVIVTRWSKERALNRAWGRSLWYSLDKALPVVNFDENFKKYQHDSKWVTSYFRIHSLLGFLFTTIFIGAISIGL